MKFFVKFFELRNKMKIFVIGVALAYNPFEIKNEIPDCFDQCGGIGGKCEDICGPSKYFYGNF